jgi:lipoprotein-anchoring transpeptidase ErfK/SrfK
MRWRDVNREIATRLAGSAALADERPIMVIDSIRQQLHWIDIDDELNRCYPVSTAANGMGNRVDSYKTPIGIHRVRQKIGGGAPRGMVFEARKPSGRITGNLDNREQDEITSRILWLDGLEPGVNQGGDCDTYSRYIYIHGTSDEKRIGEAVSAGCIRMNNDDVIELFEDVLVKPSREDIWRSLLKKCCTPAAGSWRRYTWAFSWRWCCSRSSSSRSLRIIFRWCSVPAKPIWYWWCFR